MTLSSLDAAFIKQKLPSSFQLFYQAQVDSTQTWAFDFLKNQPASFLPRQAIFVTDFQTAGFGRNQRVWQAAPRQNLLFSLVQKVENLDPKFGLISLKIGSLLYSVLRDWLPGFDFKIKWPNDILVNQKKIAGILIQKMAKPEYIVIGIGINIIGDLNNFSKDVALKATTAELLLRSQTKKLKNHSRESLLCRFGRLYHSSQNQIFSEQPDWLFEQLQNQLAFLNQPVFVQDDHQKIEGIFCGIDSDGCALIQKDKKVIKLSYGDLQLRSNF